MIQLNITGNNWNISTTGVFTGDSIVLGNDTTDITTSTDEDLTLGS